MIHRDFATCIHSIVAVHGDRGTFLRQLGQGLSNHWPDQLQQLWKMYLLIISTRKKDLHTHTHASTHTASTPTSHFETFLIQFSKQNSNLMQHGPRFAQSSGEITLLLLKEVLVFPTFASKHWELGVVIPMVKTARCWTLHFTADAVID